MEADKDRVQKNKFGRGDIELIILSLTSRGIDPGEHSLGAILEIEKMAHNRDQTYWACSAQNPKLLPKPDPTPGKGVESFRRAFEASTK